MKNIICPISNDKVAEHTPRLIALINIILISVYLYSGSVFIIAYQLVDFTLRAFGFAEYSLSMKLVNYITRKFNIESKKVDKAPKIFAAKLGSLMFLLALIFSIGSNTGASITILGIVAVLSALESVFSFCVGCYLYTFLILPFFKVNSKQLHAN